MAARHFEQAPPPGIILPDVKYLTLNNLPRFREYAAKQIIYSVWPSPMDRSSDPRIAQTYQSRTHQSSSKTLEAFKTLRDLAVEDLEQWYSRLEGADTPSLHGGLFQATCLHPSHEHSKNELGALSVFLADEKSLEAMSTWSKSAFDALSAGSRFDRERLIFTPEGARRWGFNRASEKSWRVRLYELFRSTFAELRGPFFGKFLPFSPDPLSSAPQKVKWLTKTKPSAVIDTLLRPPNCECTPRDVAQQFLDFAAAAAAGQASDHRDHPFPTYFLQKHTRDDDDGKTTVEPRLSRDPEGQELVDFNQRDDGQAQDFSSSERRDKNDMWDQMVRRFWPGAQLQRIDDDDDDEKKRKCKSGEQTAAGESGGDVSARGSCRGRSRTHAVKKEGEIKKEEEEEECDLSAIPAVRPSRRRRGYDG